MLVNTMWYTYSHCSSNTISPVPRQLIMSPEQGHAMQMPGITAILDEVLGARFLFYLVFHPRSKTLWSSYPHCHCPVHRKKIKIMIKWSSHHQMIKVFILAEKDMMLSWSQKKNIFHGSSSPWFFWGMVRLLPSPLMQLSMFHAVPPGAVWSVSPWWIHGTIVSWTPHENHKH